MQFRELLVTRDVSALMEETHSKGEELRRSIGAFGLTALAWARSSAPGSASPRCAHRHQIAVCITEPTPP
jgi:hypothetical protein